MRQKEEFHARTLSHFPEVNSNRRVRYHTAIHCYSVVHNSTSLDEWRSDPAEDGSECDQFFFCSPPVIRTCPFGIEREIRLEQKLSLGRAFAEIPVGRRARRSHNNELIKCHSLNSNTTRHRAASSSRCRNVNTANKK